MGSAPSTMSADPRAHQSSSSLHGGPLAFDASTNMNRTPSSGSAHAGPSSSSRPLPPLEVAALRAAALKSAQAKKNTTAAKSSSASAPPRPTKPPVKTAPQHTPKKGAKGAKGKAHKASKLNQTINRRASSELEEGEINDDNDEPPPKPSRQPRRSREGRAQQQHSSASATAPTPPSSHSQIDSPVSLSSTVPNVGIVRSTRLTISNHQTGTVTSSVFPQSPSAKGEPDRQEWLETIHNLLQDGMTPEELINQGAPTHFVAKVCEDIVAGAKNRRLWSQVREPERDGSTTPSVIGDGDEAGPSRPLSSRSRSSSSPDIEVAVAMDRARSDSESSTEAIVERMFPQQVTPAPRLVSSWAPAASGPPSPSSSTSSRLPAQAPGPLHLESYRPLTRPFTPPAPPAPPHPQPPHAHYQGHKQRRRRDLDQVRGSDTTTLNYGDEDETPPKPPTTAPPPQPAPPPELPETPPAEEKVVEQPVQPPVDLAETRRRAILSMRRHKTATPTTAAPTPPPQAGRSWNIMEEATNLEREILGSTAEVPMDIDDEIEEGEIPDEPPAPLPTPPPPPPPRAASAPGFRGVKRPHAEDMMDNTTRPTTAARAPHRRRVFCPFPQPSSRLVLIIDDDSDSESEDESPPPIPTPVIVIPSAFDTAKLLADKEENIRRLKEQIAAKLAAKRANSAAATPTGAATPSIEHRMADAAEAAERVGVAGVAADVVEAAVLAAAEESKQPAVSAPVDEDVAMEGAKDAPGRWP